MERLNMKLPNGVNTQYWADLARSAKRGSKVTIDRFWCVTEVNIADNMMTHIASFRANKHAHEFCALNGLVVVGDNSNKK
jgi:hypothetical protein